MKTGKPTRNRTAGKERGRGRRIDDVNNPTCRHHNETEGMKKEEPAPYKDRTGQAIWADCGWAWAVAWAMWTGYLAAAMDLVGSGTTPSWRIRPRASQLTKPSTILPFEKRAMVTPVIANCLFVGAMPLSSPL